MSLEACCASLNRPVPGAAAIVGHYAADMIFGVVIAEMLANVAYSKGRRQSSIPVQNNDLVG